ncbi:adenosylcobinamide-GDP ribazoletransferase [Streptosporangium sp. NPDC050855]|uniref:adenosylcobinamide-GDP ribazoletransferase n=1 Tax=Streptosporangium sp. NPDC050855 TaxID=3366194 RepID=UPI0037A5E61A
MPAPPSPDTPPTPPEPQGPPDRPSTTADGIRLAVGTLSVFPVRPGVVDRRAAGIAMAVAPLVGVAIGAVAALVLTISLWLAVTPLPASVLAVATVALLTRGLHLDGLADLADGLGSGRSAERALEIMKRSDIGPFGVVALVLTLLVQVTALHEAIRAGAGPVTLVVACAAGRLALTWACRTGVPSARPDGLGAMVAGTVRWGTVLVVTALTLAATAALAWIHELGILGGYASSSFEGDGYGYVSYVPGNGIVLDYGLTAGLGPFLAPWGLPLAVAVGLLAAWALRRRAVRRLGGVTGDVLGALVETATAATLLACTVLAN